MVFSGGFFCGTTEFHNGLFKHSDLSPTSLLYVLTRTFMLDETKGPKRSETGWDKTYTP